MAASEHAWKNGAPVNPSAHRGDNMSSSNHIILKCAKINMV